MSLSKLCKGSGARESQGELGHVLSLGIPRILLSLETFLQDDAKAKVVVNIIPAYQGRQGGGALSRLLAADQKEGKRILAGLLGQDLLRETEIIAKKTETSQDFVVKILAQASLILLEELANLLGAGTDPEEIREAAQKQRKAYMGEEETFSLSDGLSVLSNILLQGLGRL